MEFNLLTTEHFQLKRNDVNIVNVDELAQCSNYQPRMYIGTCTTAAATSAKIATVESFPVDTNEKPLIGTIIGIKYTETNTGTNPTLNVNNTGDASIWYGSLVLTTASADLAKAGYADRYIYYMWDGTYWVFTGWGYDTDTDTIGVTLHTKYDLRPVTTACGRRRLLFSDKTNTHWIPANSSTDTSYATAKTPTSEPINPFGRIVFYNSRTNLSQGGTPAAATMCDQIYASALYLGYSFTPSTLTYPAPVYIKCHPQNDGTAIIDSSTPYVQTLPNNADNCIYIHIGHAVTESLIELQLEKPVYYNDGTGIKLWTGDEKIENIVQYDDEEIAIIPDIDTTDVDVVPRDLSYYDVQGRIQNTRETANSYVISKTGYYKLPLIYGNGIVDDETNSSAYTNNNGAYQSDFVNYLGNTVSSPYIEEDTGVDAVSAGIEISDTPNIIDSIKIKSYPDEDCRFLQFRVKQIPSTGANAVLSIHDGDNNIMWSWHIWLWKESLKPVTIENYSGNEYDILPVNLGSKYDNTGHLINWFYQWGRKDPMLLPESYNNNTNHASYGSLSYSVENCASSVAQAIKNPCTFYKSGGNHSNWTSQVNYYYNFWDATCDSTGFIEKTIVKTIYDPCPRGFCVPNARVFTGFTSTGDNTNISSLFDVTSSWNNGWNFRAIGEGSSIFFSASGYRNDGIGYVGLEGYYWTTGNGNEDYASSLSFSNSDINPLYNLSRSYACSIRPCMMYDETDLDISGLGVFSKVDSKELIENKVTTSINSLSTHIQYPSAKCVYNWMLDLFDNQGSVVIDNHSTVGFYVDLSRCDINLKPQATRETANCYIIARPGFYCFPLVMGCGLKETRVPGDVDLNAKSYAPFGFTSPYLTGVYDSTILLTDADSITISSFTFLEGGYLGFYVSSIPEDGANYIIGVVDEQGNIIWSWHIWLWKESLSLDHITNYSGNTYDIFPVNLGSRYVSGELKSWFYQWGRKDPMPYSDLSGFSVVTGIGQDPGEFYTDWTAPYNAWNTNATSATSDESNIIKSIYDPCPRGFCVPNARVFTGFTSTGEDSTAPEHFNVIGTWNSGWNFKQFYSDTDGSLFLALGYRPDQLSNDGLEGYYWTSGMNSLGKGCGLSFGETFISYPQMNLNYGCSIRPCKES